jgi:hypothetical protein
MNSTQKFKTVIYIIFGAFVGFLIGRLAKSPEIILIGIPLGGLIGYKFTNYFSIFFKHFFRIIRILIRKIFKQI